MIDESQVLIKFQAVFSPGNWTATAEDMELRPYSDRAPNRAREEDVAYFVAAASNASVSPQDRPCIRCPTRTRIPSNSGLSNKALNQSFEGNCLDD